MKNYIVFFDGVCNLCNSWVQFIIENDERKQFKFASLQSEAGQRFLKERNLNSNSFDTIILYQPDLAYYVKSSAILKIVKTLGFPYKFLCVFYIFPPFIRDRIYLLIAKNRYKLFGKNESCMLPSPDLNERFLK